MAPQTQLDQATLGRYASDDADTDDSWPPYDEYGPTSRRPLPDPQPPVGGERDPV